MNLYAPTLFDEKTLTWRGGSNCPHVFDPKMSIGKAALFVLNQNLDFVAQISDNSGVKKTNREIRDSMLKIAVNLTKIGCTKGDVVGFLSTNTDELAGAVLATFLLAAPVNPLDPSAGKADIIHMFGLTRPKFIFCEDNKLPILVEALESLNHKAQIVVLGERIKAYHHIDDFLVDPGNLNENDFPDVDAETFAFILCSSGTTGMPKGVCISHRTLLYFAAYGIGIDTHKPQSIFCFSSLYWYTGVLTLLMGTMMGLTRIITNKPYNQDLLYQIIVKHRPNIMFVVSMHIFGILKHPLVTKSTMDSIRYLLFTGTTLSEETWMKIKVYLPNGYFNCGYGMTEMGWVAHEPKDAAYPSVGNILSGTEMKILDKEGKKLGIGQQGELCMKWEHRFLYYYKDPERTAELVDKDGWIHSGDTAYFDSNNYLHIVGRSKDIINYEHVHIAPIELENLIMSLPGVQEVVAVGIPHPTIEDLHFPAAVLIRHEGASVTEKDIEVIIEKNLADSKRLRGGVYFVNSFPRTPSGKIKRNLVTEIATKLYKEKNP
uniref:Putative acyl-coa synthetase n=1 Tax=Nyssomyia neivai TaxID=330878 RepID=A0A1L8DYC8_9DIPT